ncbi:MAG: DNA repair protein, partial [Actinobacteria bacterium]|nr:DNA repair protein [Actinomycetota bacterium]
MLGPDAIHFTGDTEADRLLARDPLALLIGFALDQQVTVQQAFAGPL